MSTLADWKPKNIFFGLALSVEKTTCLSRLARVMNKQLMNKQKPRKRLVI
jgi:hypothetical protein